MAVQKKRQILEYSVWVFCGVILLGLKKIFPDIFNNSFFFSLGFLFILFLPGWLLSRLIRFSFRDSIDKISSYFILGLGFYFAINFVAIFSGVGIGLLSKVIFAILLIMFIGAFSHDWLKPTKNVEILNSFFKLENIFYLIPIFVGGFILWIISVSGPNLNGDPYFHLAIIRKVIDGNSLSARSLAFTKNLEINVAYVYPVWHIFLGFASKVFSNSIFTTWSNIIYTLTIFSMLSWYCLAKVIFQKKTMAILALLLMSIFVFYNGPGYLFSRIGVPDTLAQLVLLPSSLALSLEYIFESSRKKLILIGLVAFMLLVLHGSHYFYLIISILFFGLCYSVIAFKDKDYKQVLLRVIKVSLVEIAVLLILTIAMQLRSRTLISTVMDFYKSSGGVMFSTSFFKFGLVYKYGFFLLPMALIFLKLRRWIFLVSNMLLTPLVYWTPFKDFFNKTLSGIFTDRLLANTSLYFFIFTVLIVIVLILTEHLFSRFLHLGRLLINIFFIVFFALLTFLEISNHTVSDFTYKVLYAKPTNVFVNVHYFWFFLGGIGLMLIVFLLNHKKGLLPNGEYNDLTVFLMMTIIVFVLLSPSFVNAKNILNQNQKKGADFFLVSLVNNQNAVEFVKDHLPQKSVILASGSASKGLVVFTNQYMAYDVGSAYEKKFQWVFDSQMQDSAKAEIVLSPKWGIDYIYLENPNLENLHFRLHPELYQLIYNNGRTEIYKIRR